MEDWSSRELQVQISSMFYERTALSKQPDALIRQELEKMSKTGQPATSMLLKDPYLLDFLGLNDRYLEKDLEDAILRETEQFLLELGAVIFSDKFNQHILPKKYKIMLNIA